MTYVRINSKKIKETMYGQVVKCPVCGYEFIAREWKRGETIRCPRCGALLRIK